jgi:DNA-binding CsgD family transcriptional regulator/tetratricopeptide (TPR) repeat protein
MPGPVGHPLGRDEELAQVARFIESVTEGPGALLFEGGAGIGKTTLWREAIDIARERGFTVLSTRPVESDTAFSYSALGDLFEDVLDAALPELPAPQQHAIEIALLRAEADGPPPDQYAVAMAGLGVLRSLAASAPVILAVDDVHWIDPSSARALGFAIRRVGNEAVGILATARTGLPIPPVLTRALSEVPLRRMTVGSMQAKVLGALLREHLGADLPRPLVIRLHAIADGNPFYALEMARALLREGVHPDPTRPLPVPEDLQQLLGARLATLPSTAAAPLFVVAATARPTEDLVVAAAGRRDHVLAGLAAAEEADIIRRDGGQIRFTHPLLGSTLYAATSPQTRRALHGHLAELVADPEERARHLALAATGPDPDVARSLDEAARHARARGAPDAGADLTELARQLTPPEDADALRRRSLAAADYHFDAGDTERASALLEDAIASSPPGPERAEILYRLSSMSWMNLENGVRRSLERALPEAGDDPELLSGIHVNLAWVDIYQGDLASASEHAGISVACADRITDPSVRSDALSTLGMVEFLLGRPAHDLMTEAVELQDIGMTNTGSWTEASVYTTPRSMLGLQLTWAGQLDAARTLFRFELAEYERHAMYTVRQEVLCYLADLECRAGRWQISADYAAEAMDTVVESGRTATQSHVVLFNQARAAAHLGQVDIARSQAVQGVELALSNDDPFNASWNRAALGFLELSLSNHEQAHAHLRPVVEYLDEMGAAEPGVIPCVPDAIEALIALGELDSADELLVGHEEKGRALDRPWALATAGRCRGLLAAARGDQPASMAAFEQAMEQHVRLPMPFELARSLLVLGEAQRRFKQRRAAGASLRAALETFEALGASLWAEKARAELARTGSQAASPGELTPTEQRVAELVAQGHTNREVADALFVSVKTVEANLSRIFQKLGISSRRQL